MDRKERIIGLSLTILLHIFVIRCFFVLTSQSNTPIKEEPLNVQAGYLLLYVLVLVWSISLYIKKNK
tara:strand:+ start:459 stop:659 length:201 start_codon:yes stop_codon:yes gene_type:complete